MAEMRNVYTIFVGTPERKRSRGRPGRIWDENIRMAVTEMGGGGGGVDWMYLVQDRNQWQDLLNTVVNLRFP
jgi:hypothetical protein